MKLGLANTPMNLTREAQVIGRPLGGEANPRDNL